MTPSLLNSFILVCSVHATPTLCHNLGEGSLLCGQTHRERLTWSTTVVQKKKKEIITRHFKLPRRPYSDLLWNSERVKWGLLWELEGKIYILLNVMRKKESEGEEEGEISQLRCCALSLISKFTDLATVNIYPHSVGDRQNDVKTEADFLFQVWHVACVHVYVFGGSVSLNTADSVVLAFRIRCLQDAMRAWKASQLLLSVCVCVLRFLPFFPQLQGFFLV